MSAFNDDKAYIQALESALFFMCETYEENYRNLVEDQIAGEEAMMKFSSIQTTRARFAVTALAKMPKKQGRLSDIVDHIKERKERESMVGGIIKEIIHCFRSTWINCQGTGDEAQDECAIHVKGFPEVQVGDHLWWQGDKAYWTRKEHLSNSSKRESGKEYDIPLEKIGFSGVSRPSKEAISER